MRVAVASLALVLVAAAPTFAAIAQSFSPPSSSPTSQSGNYTGQSNNTLSNGPLVPGKAFDRFIQIWLENTDFATAASSPVFQRLAAQGITLTQFYALTHPSEPNYCAAAGGDFFGMGDDSFYAIPSNISTIVDLLDAKSISWESSTTEHPAARKMSHSKQKLGKYPMALDSPAYDASEEDNDATDDGASAFSIPRAGTGTALRGRATLAARRAVASGLAGAVLSESDTGVDSPTYDGDVESASTITANTSATASTASPGSAASSLPPHADAETTPPMSIHPLPQPLVAVAITEPTPTFEVQQTLDPASLTPDEIQHFVRDAIESSKSMPVRIREPPTDRPVRVYADGVYDLFHFGHALQLRQAKLSFPSVTLLVGVCSDELCKDHKSRTVMTHAERCEAVRHCRWVDHVVADAPWIIDQDFIDKYAIDYVAHDDSPYAGIGTDDVYSYVKSQGRFIPTRRTPGVSTSELLERIVSGYRKKEFDAKLEKMGRPSLKAAGSDFEDTDSGGH